MEFPKTIGTLFYRRKFSSQSKNAIGWIENGHLRFHSLEEYKKIVEVLTLSLIRLGIVRDIKVAILSCSRKEWHFCDLSIMIAGGIVVPIFPSYTGHEIEYILNHSESEVLVLEDGKQLLKILSRFSRLKKIKKLIFLDPPPQDLAHQVPSDVEIVLFTDMLKEGMAEMEKGQFNFKDQIDSLPDTAIATIVYSSGSGSVPNGSVITHRALVTTLNNLKGVSKGTFGPKDRTLICLPLSHILGRIDSLCPLVFGWEMVFSNAPTMGLRDLSLVRPTILITVPKMLERIRDKLRDTHIGQNVLASSAFGWALDSSSQYHEKIQLDLSPSPGEIFVHSLVKKLLYKSINEQMGGRIRFILCGGDFLSIPVYKFFRNIGLSILESYGLTETTGPCTLNPLAKQVPGTAGIPIGDVEIKFSQEREILIKSKGLFSYYHKDPQRTKESMKDGWFHTGDLGRLNAEGFLEILGRKNDHFTKATGEKIFPSKIEQLMTSKKHLGHFIVYGEGRSFLVGVVGLEKDSFNHSLAKFGLDPHCSFKELIENPGVYDLIEREIEDVNLVLPPGERVKKFVIFPEEFSIEGGQLAPTFKVRKRQVVERISIEIEALYEEENRP